MTSELIVRKYSAKRWRQKPDYRGMDAKVIARQLNGGEEVETTSFKKG